MVSNFRLCGEYFTDMQHLIFALSCAVFGFLIRLSINKIRLTINLQQDTQTIVDLQKTLQLTKNKKA